MQGLYYTSKDFIWQAVQDRDDVKLEKKYWGTYFQDGTHLLF